MHSQYKVVGSILKMGHVNGFDKHIEIPYTKDAYTHTNKAEQSGYRKYPT